MFTDFIPIVTMVLAKGKMETSHSAGPAELVSQTSGCTVPVRFSQPQNLIQQQLIVVFSDCAGPMLGGPNNSEIDITNCQLCVYLSFLSIRSYHQS